MVSLNLILLSACLCQVAMGAIFSPMGSRISASVRDTSIEGLDSLNLNVVVPFRVQNYVIGFKSALTDLKKAPDSFFAKKTFHTGIDDAKLALDVEYDIGSHNAGLTAHLSSNNLGASMLIDADTSNRLKHVNVRKHHEVNNVGMSLMAGYNVLKKQFSVISSLSHRSTSMAIKYDTESQDPLLAVTQSFDGWNTDVTPSVAFKSKLFGCAITRRWNGGSLTSKISSDKKALLQWRDDTATGSWATSAEFSTPTSFDAGILSVPTKISISRDWQC